FHSSGSDIAIPKTVLKLEVLGVSVSRYTSSLAYGENPKDVNFHYADFWFQVHDLPSRIIGHSDSSSQKLLDSPEGELVKGWPEEIRAEVRHWNRKRSL
ncbi:hypothetical protein Golax_025423, partial [Gossypium laxum]|nr:hypothetical protein [Gossypium laxum]